MEYVYVQLKYPYKKYRAGQVIPVSPPIATDLIRTGIAEQPDGPLSEAVRRDTPKVEKRDG